MSQAGQALLLLEPRIEGPRRSGGFFYNDCLAAAALAREGSHAPPEGDGLPRFSLQAWDDGRLPQAVVLLDSLWWYVHKKPLDALATALARRSWGIIMHGLPDADCGLLSDMAEASFVVTPSFWAAGRLGSVRSSLAAGGRLDLRVLYPGWDGRLGLMAGGGHRRGSTLAIASSSNWSRAKGMVEAAAALGSLSLQSACPPWLWRAAGTPDQGLIEEARRSLGPFAGRLETLGHLAPEALLPLINNADIFLHPSGQETFSLSVFEAALAGRRIVARALGGIPEALKLAALLRRELGLAPAAAHLAPDAEARYGDRPGHEPPAALEETLEETLEMALEAALLAASVEALSQERSDERSDARSDAPYSPPRLAAIQAGPLREYSWPGRLEKLLLGQSDQPLPAIIHTERVEAS